MLNFTVPWKLDSTRLYWIMLLC